MISIELRIVCDIFLDEHVSTMKRNSCRRKPNFKIILCFAQKRYSIGSLAAKANMVSALKDLCKNQLTKQNL